MVKGFDWAIRMWNVRQIPTFLSASRLTLSHPQPYLLLSKGNAPASETVLLNYVSSSSPLLFFFHVTDCQRRLEIGE